MLLKDFLNKLPKEVSFKVKQGKSIVEDVESVQNEMVLNSSLNKSDELVIKITKTADEKETK